MDYNPRYLINNKSTLHLRVGGRTIFPKAWYRVYVNPSIRYDLTSFNAKTERYRTWQLHGGLGMFYTHNLEASDVLEIRPFQGLRVRIPNWDKFPLMHYVRLEERIEVGFNSKVSEFSIRARYRVGNDFYFPGKFFMRGFYIPLYVELFFNLKRGAQFNDLLRLTPGLGYTPNEIWRFQFDLSYHRTRDTVEEGFQTNDIVFRFRVYQKL